jgi:hypothetical protein
MSRRARRIKWLASCTRWTQIGTERMYNEILLTRVSRKPPAYKCETTDINGNAVVLALEKATKPIKGWVVYLPDGKAEGFRIKREAMAFISALQVTEAAPINVPHTRAVEPEQL